MVGEESTGQLLRSFSHTFALSLTISPWNSRNEWTKRMRDGNENGAVSKGKRTVSERTTVTIGTLTELTPTPRFSCYVHALGSLTSSLHLRLLTSYGSSSSRSTSCGPQSFGLSAGSLSPFNVTTAVPLTHFSAVTLKSFNHQAVTKGLSSTSKFSGSCVPTLQTLPHFHLLPILWFPSFTYVHSVNHKIEGKCKWIRFVFPSYRMS